MYNTCGYAGTVKKGLGGELDPSHSYLSSASSATPANHLPTVSSNTGGTSTFLKREREDEIRQC